MDLSLDLTGVSEMQGNSPVPPGEYNVVIAATEYKESKRGTGGYLRMQYKISDGPHNGRSVFDNLNLWHEQQNTRYIAQSRLKAIAKAVGHPNPNFIRNTDELLGGRMLVRVSVSDEYNNVKSYSPPKLQQQPVTQQSTYQTQAQTPPPPQTPANAATPWS